MVVSGSGVTSRAPWGGTRVVRPPRRPRRGRRALKVALLAVLFVLVAAPLHARRRLRRGGAHAARPSNWPTASPSPQTTKIYDASATPVLLAELHGLENREVLAGDEIPQVMRDAMVAVGGSALLRAQRRRLPRHPAGGLGERPPPGDRPGRFDHHPAADQERLRHRRADRGDRKLREAALAYQLENRWSKEKILNEYLNIIYFGSGAYGIQAAAQHVLRCARQGPDPRAGGAAGRSARGPLGLLAPARPRGRPGPPRPGAQQDVPAALHHQRSNCRRPWRLRCSWPTPGSDGEARAPTGWRWCGSNSSPATVRRLCWAAGCGSTRAWTCGCSRRPRRPWTTCSSTQARSDPSAPRALVAIDVQHRTSGGHGGGGGLSDAPVQPGHPGPAAARLGLQALRRWSTALQQGISPETTYDSGPVTVDLPAAWDHRLHRRRAADPGQGDRATPPTVSSPG